MNANLTTAFPKVWMSKQALQENKAHQIFQKTSISYPLLRTPTCAYQWVRNVRFCENLACFVFLEHSFWDSCFCLITDGICKQKSQFWPTFVAYLVKQLGSWQLYIKSLLYIYTVLERSFVIIFTVCGLFSLAVYCIFYISVQRFC